MGPSSWSNEDKVRALLSLPWNVNVEVTREGERLAWIDEMPAAAARGSDIPELARALWAALRAVLERSLRDGESITLPRGAVLFWERQTHDDARARVERLLEPGERDRRSERVPNEARDGGERCSRRRLRGTGSRRVPR